MSIKKDIIAIFIGLIIFISVFGSVYTVKLEAPGHAVVYADPEKKVYYAPPYIDGLMSQSKLPKEIDAKKLKPYPMAEARVMQYRADETSRERGYFVQQYRSLSSYILEKAKIVKPLPTRWNKDGTWNW